MMDDLGHKKLDICSIDCMVDLGHIKLDQTLTKCDDLDHISTGSLIFFRKLLMLL